MTVQELIEYTKLQNAGMEEYVTRIYAIADRIAKRKLKLRALKDQDNYGLPFNSVAGSDISIEIIDSGAIVEVEWEEYWRYGGHDSGCISFNINLLESEQNVIDFLNEILPEEHTQVREGFFETNSSSSHSITMGAGEIDYCRIMAGTPIAIIDGRLEFGWEQDEYNDSPTKAAYAWIYIRDWAEGEKQVKFKELFEDVVKSQLGVDEIQYIDGYGYIDHQSAEEGLLDWLFDDADVLRNFIFNRNTWLETDNDNRE